MITEPKNTDAPTAVRYATYRGNVTEMVGRQLVGPNTMGEILTPVSAIYDSLNDRTRVGFAYGDHRTADEAVTA